MRSGPQPVVVGLPAVRGRVGERANDPEQLDDRPGPAVRDDQRKRALVRGRDVDEVDVHPVDLGLELWQCVQAGLARAPVVIARPVARELPDGRQLHALRPVGDQLLARQARRADAPLKVGDRLVRHVGPEGTDFSFAGQCVFASWIEPVTSTARGHSAPFCVFPAGCGCRSMHHRPRPQLAPAPPGRPWSSVVLITPRRLLSKSR